ncbi:DUF4230 domain-containing protein [Sphingomonas aracearum]|uniref:DUF4230 domain-containing protein n=1 Tax=Sphingomonas aracearum TaxID=2283317 RepID=A0A369VYT6_9SPHN|nr:DUF4230 domain-containing protein [Sphingomonas aracearum]RDE07478.1 DUF4230 domain-containing protein [Sphingomonas aracearum]
MNGRAIVQVVVGVLVIGALLLAARIGYDRYTEHYVVERRDDGQAVTKVVAATFARASALKVGQLSGTVQSTASDSRLWGMLSSDKVVKAPFQVDYFVDVSRLGRDAYRWDQANRTLTIDAPDIHAGKPNVDEAAATLSQTRGLFVTRKAADQLARRASGAAQNAARAEAAKPERVAQARDNARRALGQLVRAPLEAAGIAGVRVIVTFPYERGGDTERWDVSRSIPEVLANAR